MTRPLALITGASGIGLSIAKQLAPEYDLVVISQSELSLSLLKRQIEERFEQTTVTTFCMDLNEIQCIREQIPVFLENKKLDVIVNNAGVWYEEPFSTLTDEKVDRSINVNFTAPTELIRQCLPFMAIGNSCDRDSTIINICSISSRKTYVKGHYYAATKAALLSFTQCMFIEYQDQGIRFCAILPGLVDTPMHKNEEIDERCMLTPEFVAETVNYVINAPFPVTEITLMPRYSKAKKF